MKYLFISGTDFENRKLTGAHKRFIELVISFAERNIVSLISFPYNEFEGKGIFLYPIVVRKGKKFPNHISEALTLEHALRKYKDQIQYDVAIAFGQTAAISYKRAGYKNVVTLFREDLIGYQKAVHASRIKIMYSWIQEKMAIDASSMIIVQCKNDRDSLIKRHKGINNKVFIQGNNINVSWIKKYTRNEEVVNVAPVIIFIGNFSSPRKGHQLLLPAAAHLLDDGVKFKLYVLGDGKELEMYKEQFSKYKDIHFVGHTNNVGDYISKADIDIVPSLIDSCPNTILEGLQAGLAVYGSNTGGIPDLLQDAEYMFDANENEIYSFLKRKLELKLFETDSKEQRKIRESLIFNWGIAIEEIILGAKNANKNQ